MSVEAVLYFDHFTDFKGFPGSKSILTYLSWKLSAEKKLQNTLSLLYLSNFRRYFFIFFLFSKDQFCCCMLKQRNFLLVVDLLFDARFVKYYQFNLRYYKQCPINNVKAKCSQIGQNMSDIFWTTSLQINSDKLR